jgi:hypothetical protein
MHCDSPEPGSKVEEITTPENGKLNANAIERMGLAALETALGAATMIADICQRACVPHNVTHSGQQLKAAAKSLFE